MEYALMERIYFLSHNKANIHNGWCWASRQTLADDIGYTKRGIIKAIDRLAELGLIEKNDRKWVAPTILYHKIAHEKIGELRPQSVNSVHQSNSVNGELSTPVSVNSVHQSGELSSPKYIDINKERKEEKIKLHSQKFSEENIQGESENDLSPSETLQEETRKEPAKKSNHYKLTEEEVKLLEPFHKGLIEEIDKLAKVKYTKSIKPICRVYDHLNKNINTLRNVYVYFRTYRDHEHKYAVVVHSLESFADKIDKLIFEAKRRTRELEAKNQSAIYHIDHNRKIVVFNSFKNIPQKDIETLKILVDEKKYNPIIMKPLVGEYNPTFFKAEPPKRNPLA